ncbi:MAG: hypothetical protein R2705_18025 [Ilumatobacteraceae bacterium]
MSIGLEEIRSSSNTMRSRTTLGDHAPVREAVQLGRDLVSRWTASSGEQWRLTTASPIILVSSPLNMSR